MARIEDTAAFLPHVEAHCIFPAELSCNTDDSLEEDLAARLQYVLATINIYIPLSFGGKH